MLYLAPSARMRSLEALWKFIEPTARAIGTMNELSEHAAYQTTFNNEQALRILKRGISSRVITPLADYLELGKGELAGTLHSAENVLRLLELKEMANDTFESEDAALGWLRRPHPMLDGESPLESAKTSFGSNRVKDILVSIKHGGVV